MSEVTRETLIIIDDEPDTLDLCQRIFRETYDVIVATTG